MEEETTVRIRLNCDLPVHKRHGALKGREYDATTNDSEARGNARYWIQGDTGERVGVLLYEADVISGEDYDADIASAPHPSAHYQRDED